MAVSRHLGFYRTGKRHSIRRPQKPLPGTKYGVDGMQRLWNIRL